ncbi:UNVERIFIED_CONTAM: hypothetical protein FKN15_004830 [Acipenser sinensis]
MEKLDCYMPRLLSLFMKKGGAAGVKLQGIQEMLYGDAVDANIQEDLTQHVLKIFVGNKGATNDDNPVDVGIAIEGAEDTPTLAGDAPRDSESLEIRGGDKRSRH